MTPPSDISPPTCSLTKVAKAVTSSLVRVSSFWSGVAGLEDLSITGGQLRVVVSMGEGLAMFHINILAGGRSNSKKA
jgi:hypothetical protein